jgi:HD-like signal output (HDOD) protein
MSMREAILSSLDSVPQIPAAAAQVLTLCQDPDTGIADIMQVLESDPGLTAETLRLANSAYFAGPRSIATLREAGVLFGTNRIAQLVLAAAIFPLARKPVPGYELEEGGLMDELVCVGVGAEELARVLERTPPAHAFTVGLLHDIGKVALGAFVADYADEVRALSFDRGLSFEAAESELFGTDRCEVGAALLEMWQLPQQVVDGVRWHMDPDHAVFGNEVPDLVHMARHLALTCGIGLGMEGLHYTPARTTLSRLNLNDFLLERVTARMLIAFEGVKAQLSAIRNVDSD